MKYKDINDYYLVDMVCENNDDYCNVLFNKYQPVIKKIVYKYYKEYSDYGYDLDDFIQEGNYALFKALKNFNPKRNVIFYTFVSLCVKRQILSFIRMITSKRYNYVFISAEDYNFDNMFNVNYDFDYNLYFDELIKEVIFDNELDYSCVFELRINNFTFREIHELLGISISQAEYRFKKMKYLLKEKMENYLNKKTE
ncbi:MAG: sigma-70 family RNA polymerase sigma factor [Bacilli bacterium]|nr:sigma-70 family RNA polymerase sigma factor [Bacilli bacterium]